MSGISGSLMLVFVVIVSIALFLFYLLLVRTRQANESRFAAPEKKPDRLQTLLPSAPASSVSGFVEEAASEKLAAPFAEQIEDIIHDLVASDPALAGTLVDFGTAPDGTLEIWVNDKRYADSHHVPDERIRDVIQKAVAMYNEQYTKS